MRLLHSASRPDLVPREVDGPTLAHLYAFPDRPWLRVNFVSTLDGAATGADGRTDSINTAADNAVFALQRELCDVVVAGAGTARIEGYEPVERSGGRPPLLAVVSDSGRMPPSLAVVREGRGDAVLVTCADAAPSAVAHARERLGADNVWVLGQRTVDLEATKAELVRRRGPRLLCEGGPTLFASLLAAGLVDELALTWAPALVAGAHSRITSGIAVDVALHPALLLEADGTLLGLWCVDR